LDELIKVQQTPEQTFAKPNKLAGNEREHCRVTIPGLQHKNSVENWV